MPRELWTADGYLLTNNRVRDVSIDSKIYSTPAKRGENSELYGQHGSAWRAKYYGNGQVTINTWSNGVTGTHALATAQQAALDEYRRTLAVIDKQYGLVEYRRYWDDGSRSYRNYGEMVQSVEPVYVHPGHFRWGFEVVFPNPFWTGDTEYTHSTPQGAINVDLTLTNHADSTAPMEDFRYVITGPVVNPTVRLTVPGANPAPYFLYRATIASGDQVTIDSSNFTVTGANANPALLEYNMSRFMTVYPAPLTTAPVVRFEGSSAGASTRLSVIGKSKVLI